METFLDGHQVASPWRTITLPGAGNGAIRADAFLLGSGCSRLWYTDFG